MSHSGAELKLQIVNVVLSDHRSGSESYNNMLYPLCGIKISFLQVTVQLLAPPGNEPCAVLGMVSWKAVFSDFCLFGRLSPSAPPETRARA